MSMQTQFDSLQGTRVERFVDSDEAARFIGLNSKTLQRLARQGVIPAHALGDGMRKRWRFLISELDEWMRKR